MPALDVYYRRVDFVPPAARTQVHDEVNISKPKEEAAEWYQDIMENCLDLEVESVAEPGVGRNWTEAKAEQDEKEVYIDWVKRGQPIDELFA